MLLEVNRPFIFGDNYLKAFETLKQVLVTTRILITPNWSQLFELTCDASNYVMGDTLVRQKGSQPIAYACKTLNEAQ